MTAQPTLTRADIMTRAAITRDVMTFWVRGGVLQPIEAPSGTGNRLRFHWYELNIAAVMNQLRILGVKIEGMLSIGRVFRDAIYFFEQLSLSRPQVEALWTLFTIESNVQAERLEWLQYRAVMELPGFAEKYPHLVGAAADYSVQDELVAKILAAAEERHGDHRVTSEVVEARTRISKEDFYKHLDPYLTITEKPKPGDPGVGNGMVEDMTFFWRSGEGEEYRFAWGSQASKDIREDGATALIAVDVSSALCRVWNSAADQGADE